MDFTYQPVERYRAIMALLFIIYIFSWAVFRENPRHCYSLVVIVVQKLQHFVLSLLLQRTLTQNSEYVITIQKAVHTIKGDNSKYFFQNYAPFST